MIFTPTPLKDAYVVEMERFEDERGFFCEVWKDTEARKHDIDVTFNRSNLSFNKTKGTVRGLHAQAEPYAEAKLVRCLRGAIYDAIVDIRPDSPTYMRWFGVELSAENKRLLYVPRGFLHGFQTLLDESEVYYEVAGHYQPDQEMGARFDDPAFGIQWPLSSKLILSPKDQQWPAFKSVSTPIT